MAFFRKKAVIIQAFTFDESIDYGRHATNAVAPAMPWSFKFFGHPITHENDKCYIIPTLEGSQYFTPDDMLIVGVKNEIYPCKRDIFELTYEAVELDSKASQVPEPGVLIGPHGNPVCVAAAGAALQDACHHLSKTAGWWYHAPSGLDLITVINEPEGSVMKLLAGALVAQKLCLGHSEISEAMEGHRKGLMDDKLPHRKMVEVEIADAIIRLCDLAGALKLDLGGAIAEKLAFNQKRPDHKPENRAKEGGKSY